ncbi:MAG: hypothetical protein Q8Q67_01825 [bacterium]|nr:hypothetical protein [bacterium]
MKKPTKFRLLMAIAGSLILMMIALLSLEHFGLIRIPDIDSVRLYRHDRFSFGAPEYFHLPHSYSRIWDLTLLPIFIGLLLWSWRYAKHESNLKHLLLVTLVFMGAAYLLTSNIVSLVAALVFAVVSGFSFGHWTALFISTTLGLIIGLVSFGLLIGLISSFGAFALFSGVKRIL